MDEGEGRPAGLYNTPQPQLAFEESDDRLREDAMKLIVRRKPKDFDAWKKLVSGMDGMRQKHGSRGATVYRNAKDRNDVVMVFDWDDQKPYTSYFGLPDVQKALAETGTTEIIEVSESFRIDA